MLDWHARWRSRDDVPWAIFFKEIEGGTYVASAPNVYRYGMHQLFKKEIEIARGAVVAAAQH